MKKKNERRWRLGSILIPAIIFFSAFVLRTAFIGGHFGQDEVYYVGYTKDLITGKPFSSVFPPFFYMFMAPFVGIFGDSEILIHSYMAFLGSINVLVVYLFGKKFLNQAAGIVAAVLLTFNTTHFFFSDFAMLDMPVTLFATAGFYFFWSWYKERKERDLVLGSLFTLFSTMTKYGIFPSVVMIAFLLFYERKVFSDRRFLFVLLVPFILFGAYFLSSMRPDFLFHLRFTWQNQAVSISIHMYDIVKYVFYGSLAVIGLLVIAFPLLSKGKKIQLMLLLPLIAFAAYMFFYINTIGWLWNWWSSYLTGQLSINLPYYVYMEYTYSEYLLPVLALFVIFAVIFLEGERRKIHAKLSYVFLAAFILVYLYVSSMYLQPMTEAAIGFLSLLVLGLYYYQKKDVHKYLILIVLVVFLFYSPIKVKFARYVLPALPALYLLIGQMLSDIRKFKWFFLIGILAIAWFMASNLEDTANKLLIDREINTIKFQAQDYINQSSPQCSQVYSSTWYGLYYLRNRVSDLPADIGNLAAAVKSKCGCPPKFVLFEGASDSDISSALTLDKQFSGSTVQYKYLDKGKVENLTIAPIQVYKINESFVSSVCGTKFE